MCLCQLSTECDRCVLHTCAHKHAKQETDEPVLLRHQDLQDGDWSAASPESFLITRSERWREGKRVIQSQVAAEGVAHTRNLGEGAGPFPA